MGSHSGFTPVGQCPPWPMKGPIPEPIKEVEAPVVAIPLLSTSLHFLHPAPVGLTAAPLHLRNNRPNLKLLLQLNWAPQPHHVPEMPPNLTQSPARRHSSLPHPPIRPPHHPLLKTKTRALRISPLLGAENGNFDIEPSRVKPRSSRLVTAILLHFMRKTGCQKRGTPIGTLKWHPAVPMWW